LIPIPKPWGVTASKSQIELAFDEQNPILFQLIDQIKKGLKTNKITSFWHDEDSMPEYNIRLKFWKLL